MKIIIILSQHLQAKQSNYTWIILAIILAACCILPMMLMKRRKNNPGNPGSPGKYICPMHPEVQSDKPGKCPKCGMDLIEKK